MPAEDTRVHRVCPGAQKSNRSTVQDRHGDRKAIAPTGFKKNRALKDAAEDRAVGREKANHQQNGRQQKDDQHPERNY